MDGQDSFDPRCRICAKPLTMEMEWDEDTCVDCLHDLAPRWPSPIHPLFKDIIDAHLKRV